MMAALQDGSTDFIKNAHHHCDSTHRLFSQPLRQSCFPSVVQSSNLSESFPVLHVASLFFLLNLEFLCSTSSHLGSTSHSKHQEPPLPSGAGTCCLRFSPAGRCDCDWKVNRAFLQGPLYSQTRKTQEVARGTQTEGLMLGSVMPCEG